MFSKNLAIATLATIGLFGAAALTLDVDIRLKDDLAEATPARQLSGHPLSTAAAPGEGDRNWWRSLPDTRLSAGRMAGGIY